MVTSSQTVIVRKLDLVSCKTLERLGGWLMCEIYLNTYFQRARLGGRLICEIGLYASIYGMCNDARAPEIAPCLRKKEVVLNIEDYFSPSRK